MRIRRDISSIPFQSAGETWQRIIELVTGPDSKDVLQLENAAGVMGSLITDEFPLKRAIMLEGVGPQLRVYCRFGMKAVEEGAKVDALTWNPTAGDWTMHVPCDADNLKWVKDSLAKTSPGSRSSTSMKPTMPRKKSYRRRQRAVTHLLLIGISRGHSNGDQYLFSGFQPDAQHCVFER